MEREASPFSPSLASTCRVYIHYPWPKHTPIEAYGSQHCRYSYKEEHKRSAYYHYLLTTMVYVVAR